MSQLYICIKAALEGGYAALSCLSKSIEVKERDFMGSHAIATNADYASQKAVLDTINFYDKKSLFITEEHVEDENFRKRLIGVNELDKMLDNEVYVIDELDGSSSRATGHYEWSVSIGCVQNLEHIAGAVFAPEVKGGVLFYAKKEKGAFARFIKNEPGKDFVPDKRVFVQERKIKDSYAIFGPDCPMPKYPVHNRLMNEIASRVRTVNINGSCALPMGMIAAGMADCLIEPLICPWDWAAGKIIVEETRGKIVFYEMPVPKKCVPIDKLEPRHYYPGNDKRVLGLVAGNPEIVDFVSEMMFSM